MGEQYMTSYDFLNYTLIAGLLILFTVVSYTSYRIAQAFRAIKLLAERVGGVASNLPTIKERIKIGVLNSIGNFLNGFLKEVNINGKR